MNTSVHCEIRRGDFRNAVKMESFVLWKVGIQPEIGFCFVHHALPPINIQNCVACVTHTHMAAALTVVRRMQMLNRHGNFPAHFKTLQYAIAQATRERGLSVK